MKSKYFLRGLGFGVTVTALIFLIANLVVHPAVTDEEIMERAANLGMVAKDGTGEDAGENAESYSGENTEDSADKSGDGSSDGTDNAWADANPEDIQKEQIMS